MAKDCIRIRGARQNNLKGLNLDLPLNEFIVITGVSGSGKSSLAFDTIYSEGQRRYVETFSPYARQFLDRMDKPRADSIEGIPPAIAIDQTNPVRTSRSTVGTMTEINDHLKLLFARAAMLYCRECGAEVRRDTPDAIYRHLKKRFPAREGRAPRVAITFTVVLPENFTGEEIEAYRQQHPDIQVLAHPECPPDVLEASDFVGSTAGLIRHVRDKQPKKVVLVTECSMSDNVSVEFPDVEFVRPCNLCPHMKRITLPNILSALQKMEHRAEVEPEVAERARGAVERMLAVGRGPGR